MTLLERLQSAKIFYFANPIHYEGPYCENRTEIILKSDYTFFKPYINNWGDKKSKFYAEISKLEELQRNKLRLFDGNFSMIVPDTIIKNVKKLDQFFRAEDFLAGPQVNYSTGKYLDFDGDDSMRLDIFGKEIKEADFRFFSQNRFYIGGNKCHKRNLSLKADDDGVYENITVFQNKTKYLLIADYGENEGEADSAQFFEDGELNIAAGLIFVKDLEDNDEIQDSVMEWHSEYMNVDVPWEYNEDNRWHKIKYKNPIKFTNDSILVDK
jgi:hypothetical protein